MYNGIMKQEFFFAYCIYTMKKSTNYNCTELGFINDKIYTVDDIIRNHNFGRLKFDYFKRSGLIDKYPTIYNLIKEFNDIDYRIYSEIGVYSFEKAISGLIDILLVKNDTFIILDWKTNRVPLMFESGYFAKNPDSTLTTEFVKKDERFMYPLTHIPDSVGEHYTMQLSLYAYLIEDFGFTCKGLVLCHIRTKEDDNTDVIELYNINYRKADAELLINDYVANNIDQTNKLF
jgi:hypothetical protein